VAERTRHVPTLGIATLGGFGPREGQLQSYKVTKLQSRGRGRPSRGAKTFCARALFDRGRLRQTVDHVDRGRPSHARRIAPPPLSWLSLHELAAPPRRVLRRSTRGEHIRTPPPPHTRARGSSQQRANRVALDSPPHPLSQKGPAQLQLHSALGSPLSAQREHEHCMHPSSPMSKSKRISIARTGV